LTEFTKMKERNGHLPMFGVGPIYGGVIIALTVAGITLSVNVLKSGRFEFLWVTYREKSLRKPRDKLIIGG